MSSSTQNTYYYKTPMAEKYLLDTNLTQCDRFRGFLEKHNINLYVITGIALLAIAGTVAALAGAPTLVTVYLCSVAVGGTLGTIIQLLYYRRIKQERINDGWHELHMAIDMSKNYWFKCLLDNPRNIRFDQTTNLSGATPLHFAVANNKLTITRRLLQFPEVINTINKRLAPNPSNSKDLLDLTTAKLMIKNAGGNPNNTYTALHLAVYNADVNMVKMLMAHGANQNIESYFQKNMIDLAKECDSQEGTTKRQSIIDFLASV